MVNFTHTHTHRERMDQFSSQDRLIDYLLFVGPGPAITFDSRLYSSKSLPSTPSSSWHNINPLQPSIVKRFPPQDHENFSLTADVAYFCQPDGCYVELKEQRMHTFMLTDTESNVHTYGICLSFPHLFDPTHLNRDNKTTESCPMESDALCIQEWGVLSVCLLTHHPFFKFFQKALLSLKHFVDHFFGEDLTWNALLNCSFQVGKIYMYNVYACMYIQYRSDARYKANACLSPCFNHV